MQHNEDEKGEDKAAGMVGLCIVVLCATILGVALVASSCARHGHDSKVQIAIVEAGDKTERTMTDERAETQMR